MRKRLRAKVVLVGLPGVGKTSLVRRFISNEFTERHVQTIGVRVEKRTVELSDADVELLVWDIAGAEPDRQPHLGYLNGASAVLLVADRANASTVVALSSLHADCQARLSGVPFLVMLNKSDLETAPGVADALASLPCDGRFDTSALTGDGVAQAFTAVARRVAGE